MFMESNLTNEHKNDTQRNLTRVLSAAGCNVIRPSNYTFATDWENIPETVILNFAIGLVLFITFVILTRIAWKTADSDDQLKTQNIVTFLYGYRDPEQWYVIPRLEFLRHEDRHHKHDLLYPHIYVPPKLPLANPLEVIAQGDRTRNTTKSAEAVEAGPNHSKNVGRVETPRSASSPVPGRSTFKSFTLNGQSVDSNLTEGRTNSSQANSDATSSTALGSHFYPSILTAEQLQASYLSRRLNRFFAIFFRVSDADLIYARGIDAYEYLLFQRHLILIMTVTTLLCIGVILPVHWIAGPSADPKVVQTTSFQRSTIKNIISEPQLHWIHIVCSGVIVLTTIRVMSSYKQSIITQNDPQISRRTLLIGNIPADQRNRVKLTRVFRDYFPGVTVEAIQFVYDSKSLIDDEMYLSSIISAKDYCLAYKRRLNREIMVHKTDVNEGRVCDGYCRFCSFIYVCCCYWPREQREPGTTYYAREEEKFRKKITTTCEKLVKAPTEYAFITFKSFKQARRVMSELAVLKQDAIEGRDAPRQPSISRTLRSISEDVAGSEKVERRPKSSEETGRSTFLVSNNYSAVKDPLDPINNPHVRSIRESAYKPKSKTPMGAPKELAPAAKTVDSKKPARKSPSGWSERAPVEGPVAWSVRYAPHPDNVEFEDLLNLARTSRWTIMLLHFLMIIIFIFITTPNVILSIIERVSIMQPERAVELTGFEKLTINYLSILLQIITTAILPALVLLISKQIPYEDSSSKSHSVMWKVYSFLILMVIIMPSIGMSSAQALFANDINPKCLFPTDNGAYYINYVVSTIFLSTILELIKPVDILYYYFILWTSRSSAEIESGRQFIDREFSVGMQHTGVLLIFSVVMTYSISCPLIAPCGLIYLCIKHAVDHYNLYYSYFTKKVDKDLQTTIVMFVKVALLLMLFQTTISVYINTGTSYLSLLSQMMFWVTLATLGLNCFFDCTARTVADTKRTRYNHEFCACFYLPKVIASLLRLDAIPSKFISRKV